MISPLAKFIDWTALQLAYALVGLEHAAEPKWRLKEALEFLNGPDFISTASNAAQVEFVGPRQFKFRTPRPTEVEENNTVYGRLFKCGEHWRAQPVIVLLHGSPAVGYYSVFPWLACRLNRAGFNVATLVAPFHLQRRPRRPTEGDCYEFAWATAQSVAEIRALVGWLLGQGCPSVGLVGFSFGGWLAGLTACSDSRITSIILTVPAVRMRCSQRVIWPRVQKELQALRPAHEAMDTTRLNLLLSTPVVQKANILLIEGVHDLFVESQPIEELWKKWEQPEIWRLPHGHISALFVPALAGRMLHWLTPRLKPAERKTPERVAKHR